MDFGLSSVERYLPSSRLVYRQNKLPKTLIYLVPEALDHKDLGGDGPPAEGFTTRVRKAQRADYIGSNMLLIETGAP